MSTKRFGFAALAAALLLQGHADTAERTGPVADPLDPTPYRMRAAQVGQGLLPTATGTEFNPAISVIFDFTYAHITEEIDDPPGFGGLGGHSHAHGHDHGHGIEEGFQLREVELTLTGTVVSAVFEWPHAQLVLDTGDRQWRVVLAPPTRTRNRGLVPERVEPGARVVVVGHPHRQDETEIRAERVVVGEDTIELRR